MTADTIRRQSQAKLRQIGLRRYQEEWMMGLLLAAMLYFAAVAVCIRIVS